METSCSLCLALGPQTLWALRSQYQSELLKEPLLEMARCRRFYHLLRSQIKFTLRRLKANIEFSGLLWSHRRSVEIGFLTHRKNSVFLQIEEVFWLDVDDIFFFLSFIVAELAIRCIDLSVNIPIVSWVNFCKWWRKGEMEVGRRGGGG